MAKIAPSRAAAPREPAHTDLLREVEDLRRQVELLTARLAEAEALADTDALTPVLNRRAFLRELERTIAEVSRYHAPASLLYFDLDGFKAVNDRYGHPAGDAVLTMVAGQLISQVRRSDVVGRLGGDEFAVILAHADVKAARDKAEALGRRIAAMSVDADGVQIRVKASWGVSEIQGDEGAEQALARADAAMFLRKPGRHGA